MDVRDSDLERKEAFCLQQALPVLASGFKHSCQTQDCVKKKKKNRPKSATAAMNCFTSCHPPSLL